MKHSMKRSMNSTIRICLALTATTLLACEDVSPPAPKVAPSTVVAPPAAEVKTPPVTPPPVTPPPIAATAVPKPEPVAVETEAAKPEGALAGARRLLEAGEPGKALALATLATERTPERSAAWNVLGRVQLRMGKRKDAISSFEKAIDLNPRNSYARNNLGLTLIYEKRFEDAARALEEAVELEPVTAYMWNNLGMAYEQLDRLEEARDAYGKAAAMESDHAKESLARLKGVESVVRTARVEPEKTALPEPEPTFREIDDKRETQTATQ
jgi:Tfp pilus assembly protein PilF